MNRFDITDEGYFDTVKAFVAEGKSVTIKPKGNSMLPFIRSGRDSVVVSPVTKELEVGDIVLAKIGDRYIMHRIFEISGDALTLMGDGNPYGKENCQKSDLIGIISGIQREGGELKAPGKGRFWRMLLPFRRYILFIYRRVIPSDFAKLR